MNFSENLRRLRKAKDIKQETLAEAMNVSRQTVSKWENGTAMPDFKKLNALAEYFGVTMDELLGFNNDKDNSENINDYTKEYINELITLENTQSSEKINELYKKIKTCAVIFCVALAVIIFFMISINNQIDNLKSQIDNAQSPQVIQDNSDSDTHDMSDDASYEVLGFDKDKPWLANIRFTYAPETYSNSLNVTLEVPQNDNKTKQLKFERKGGKFVLEAQLDATIKGNYTLLAKDDSNTSTTDLTPDYTSEYFNVDDFVSTVTYENTYLQFKSEDSNNLTFNLNSKAELKKAHLKIYSSDNKDKVLYEKDCRVADNTVFLGALKAKIDYELISDGVDFEINATDGSGIKYIYSTNVNIDRSDVEFDSVESNNEQYKIEFQNGKTIVSTADDESSVDSDD